MRKGMRNGSFCFAQALTIVTPLTIRRLDEDQQMTSAATVWIGEAHKTAAPGWAAVAPLAPVAQAPARPAASESAVSLLVGKNLRRLRKQHRLSLEELARQSGVSRAMLGQIEQGKSVPSIKTLWQVAQALGVSVSWFLESGSESQVLLMAPATDSADKLAAGEGELRSLQQLGDGSRDGFYELRLAPNAVLSLPASALARRINIVVSSGVLQVDIDDTTHQVLPREALQYEALDPLVWRNTGPVDVQAFVVLRSPAKPT
jgi:transcriptional regulator with XRE-family HTH domain